MDDDDDDDDDDGDDDDASCAEDDSGAELSRDNFAWSLLRRRIAARACSGA